LGEHGEWQKFSNFEHGTRVPLIMRAPWVRESVGTRSSVLAELIDIFPTMAELAGAPLDPQTAASLDGTSLAPVLRAPADAALARALKHRALSQYMRCPRDAAQPQKANDCLFTDRSQIAFMGYTVRTHTHRFTQWAAWNGSSLRSVWQQPRWPDIGEELYSHVGDDGSDFDRYENKNCNASEPNVAAALRVLLHEAVANGSAKARVDLVLVP
jgi:iduronate 2-sulfatase